MIIEILEKGGIYAYYLQEKCLYVGKTKRDFPSRIKEHLNEENQEANKILSQYKEELELKILIDCSFCHFTSEQIDYLETCYIKQLNPSLNIRKTKNKISYTELSQGKEKQIILTKKQQIIYNAMKECAEKGKEITKENIFSVLATDEVSDKTWRRTVDFLEESNLLVKKYTNPRNYIVYELL